MVPVQCFTRPRTYDRRRDGRVPEQPRESDVGRPLAELTAEPLVRLELRPLLLHRILQALLSSASLARFLERPAEKASRERAPGQQPDPMRAAGGDDLELDGTRVQVVEALLGDDPEEVARGRGALRLGDLPPREVAAADVEDLAGGDELLHRLP